MSAIQRARMRTPSLRTATPSAPVIIARKPSLRIPARSRTRSPIATPTLGLALGLAPAKNSEGQILNGEIRVPHVGGFNPTSALRDRGSRPERVS